MFVRKLLANFNLYFLHYFVRETLQDSKSLPCVKSTQQSNVCCSRHRTHDIDFFRQSPLCRVHSIGRTTNPLPYAMRTGRRNDGDSGFDKCRTCDTRQTCCQWMAQSAAFAMCRSMPLGKASVFAVCRACVRHSLPSTCWSRVLFAEGRQKALGKDLFAECRPSDTRQTSNGHRLANGRVHVNCTFHVLQSVGCLTLGKRRRPTQRLLAHACHVLELC